MDLHELFLSCRRGDIERVRYLVEQRDVDVNVRDKWDSTPLYYACLCGHIDVVRFLLENGARCEANTFDGERCLYGALDQEIRMLLRNYKVITAHTIRRELYQEFLRKLLETGEFADVLFIVHGKKFYGHRCILAARSEYFCDMFLDKWRNRSVIVLNNEKVNPFAFEAMLQYIYTGRLEIHVDYRDDIIRLAKQCKLSSLLASVEDVANKAHFIQCTKPGTHVTTLVAEPDNKSFELQEDLGMLAEEALPMEFASWAGISELPFYPRERAPFADVIFEVEGHQFLCHKIRTSRRSDMTDLPLHHSLRHTIITCSGQTFLCGRSDYFKILMRDPFAEQTSTCWGLPLIKVRNVRAGIFVCVLYYIYQDSVEVDFETANELLSAADIFLLPGLKKQCAAVIGQHLDEENVMAVLEYARLFDLHRLEDQCYEYLAQHLEAMIDREEFHNVILSDASGVRKREEADTIDIVDNIRYYLAAANSLEEAQEQLELIDQLLEKLNLEA